MQSGVKDVRGTRNQGRTSKGGTRKERQGTGTGITVAKGGADNLNA